MGLRGPQAATVEEKHARGEVRPSRVNYEAPKLDPPAGLSPPDGLKGAGLREWRKHIAQLSSRGVVSGPDLSAFEDYCRALTELRSYEARARKETLEGAIRKGFQGMVLKLRNQVSHLRQHCGLTPLSRSSIKAYKSPSSAKAEATANASVNENPADKYLRALPGGKTS
jgi:phage terminase small subunit